MPTLQERQARQQALLAAHEYREERDGQWLVSSYRIGTRLVTRRRLVTEGCEHVAHEVLAGRALQEIRRPQASSVISFRAPEDVVRLLACAEEETTTATIIEALRAHHRSVPVMVREIGGPLVHGRLSIDGVVSATDPGWGDTSELAAAEGCALLETYGPLPEVE